MYRRSREQVQEVDYGIVLEDLDVGKEVLRKSDQTGYCKTSGYPRG